MKLLLCVLGLAALVACSGSGGGSSSSAAPLPPLPPPAYGAQFNLVQSSGAPAANTVIYVHELNCSGPGCKYTRTTDGAGITDPILVPNATYCLSVSDYIDESGALNPPQYEILITAGAQVLYEVLPACIVANQTFYAFAEQ